MQYLRFLCGMVIVVEKVTQALEEVRFRADDLGSVGEREHEADELLLVVLAEAHEPLTCL